MLHQKVYVAPYKEKKSFYPTFMTLSYFLCVGFSLAFVIIFYQNTLTFSRTFTFFSMYNNFLFIVIISFGWEWDAGWPVKV